MKRRILILGAGVMQGPAIRFAKARGWEAVVVDGDPAAPCAAEADRFERIDLKDKESIEAFARALKGDGGLDGVMTAGTDFSATVAWTAEKLGLPGIPYEVALDASDKSRMRARFRDAGVPSPRFVVVASVEAAAAGLPFDFPVVVKPVDNMGSRGCRRADDAAALAVAVADALSYSRSGRAIVEEYMEGPEFSVDALVHDGEITVCGLADRHIFFPPFFIEMGHTIPTSLGAEAAAELLSVFERGVRALGIRNGAAKGDVKLTPRGPMIGEIAARLSGGYMSGWTFPYSSGVAVTDGALSIAVGEAPRNLTPTRSWTCAERAFISIPGSVASLSGVEEARRMTGVKDLFLRAAPGSRVRFPENNVSKCGNVLAAAPDREAAVRSAESAARSVLVRLAPGDPETDAFLAGYASADPFPPSAFALPPALRAALDALPEGAASGRADPGLAPSAAVPVPPILRFPAFEDSGLADFVGRSVRESLRAVELLLGAHLRFVDAAEAASSAGAVLGAEFWRALARGGYQGAAYLVDTYRAGGARR